MKPIWKNKANFRKEWNSVKQVITMTYGDFAWSETAKKQSQSNPILRYVPTNGVGKGINRSLNLLKLDEKNMKNFLFLLYILIYCAIFIIHYRYPSIDTWRRHWWGKFLLPIIVVNENNYGSDTNPCVYCTLDNNWSACWI